MDSKKKKKKKKLICEVNIPISSARVSVLKYLYKCFRCVFLALLDILVYKYTLLFMYA